MNGLSKEEEKIVKNYSYLSELSRVSKSCLLPSGHFGLLSRLIYVILYVLCCS
jgi:hypothetical protein